MPKVLLTDIVASTAKPVHGKQVSLWDAATKHFGLRINPQGTKTWQVMIGDKRQRITIGHYPAMSLKEARKLALKTIGNGEAPPKQSTDLSPYPASTAVAKYIELRHAHSRPRYAKDEEWLLTRHLLSKHPDLPLDKFTAAHIIAITDDLAALPALQFHVHRAIKTFFKWAVQRQLIPASPVATLPRPGKINERDRLLTDTELVRIYNAAADLAYDGIATLDTNGEATIVLPISVTTEHRSFTYQAKPIGTPMPNLFIKSELSDNRFVIAGGTPGGTISWQLVGTR